MLEKERVFQDIEIVCCDCGKTFTFEAGEARYYYKKSLSLPRRCPQCRLYRKLVGPSPAQDGGVGNE